MSCENCADMFDKGYDAGNADGLADGITKGEQRILRQVAELPSPWHEWSDKFGCEWCGVASDDNWPNSTHPDTDCLWPRAQKAKEEQ